MLRLLITFILLSACAHRQDKPIVADNDPKSTDLSEVTGSQYTAVEFSKGDSALTDPIKQHLNELAAAVDRDGREVEEIKVLAWADQEYPSEAQKKASTKEILLAKDRARAIKEYLTEDLHAQEKNDIFNMAKRPGLLSKMVKTEDASVKDALEQIGPTGTVLDDGSVSYSKASKAVVIIDYK